MRARLPATLTVVKIPADSVVFAQRRVRDFVEHAARTISGHRSLRDEFADLALSCYLQGVTDGVQVAQQHPDVMALFNEAPTQESA